MKMGKKCNNCRFLKIEDVDVFFRAFCGSFWPGHNKQSFFIFKRLCVHVSLFGYTQEQYYCNLLSYRHHHHKMFRPFLPSFLNNCRKLGISTSTIWNLEPRAQRKTDQYRDLIFEVFETLSKTALPAAFQYCVSCEKLTKTDIYQEKK